MIDPNLSAFRQLPTIFMGVLGLDVDTFANLHAVPRITLLAWLTMLAVGISTALGQSVMLFLNRVKPTQFVKALLISGLNLTFSFIFWVFSTWLLARLVYDQSLPWRMLARTLAFSCSPLLIAFFTMIPYFGVSVFFLLSFWSLLGMITGLEALTALGTREALLCVSLGFVVMLLLQRTLGRPVVSLARWLEEQLIGKALERDISALYTSLQEEAAQLKTIVEDKA